MKTSSEMDQALAVLKETEQTLSKVGGGPLHCFWDDQNLDSLPDPEWIIQECKERGYHWRVKKACLAVHEVMVVLNYEERCHVFNVFSNGHCEDDECEICH